MLLLFQKVKIKSEKFIEKILKNKEGNIKRKSQEKYLEMILFFGEATLMNDIILNPADNSYFVMAILSLANYTNIFL